MAFTEAGDAGYFVMIISIWSWSLFYGMSGFQPCSKRLAEPPVTRAWHGRAQSRFCKAADIFSILQPGQAFEGGTDPEGGASVPTPPPCMRGADQRPTPAFSIYKHLPPRKKTWSFGTSFFSLCSFSFVQ